MSTRKRSHPAREYFFGLLFPSIIISFVFALIISIAALWDGITTRYISKNLLPFEVGEGETSQFLFAYVDPQIINTVATSVFWGLMSLIAIFVIWVLSNTYSTVVNLLTIETEYENKGEHYMVSVLKIAGLHALVAASSIVVVTAMLRIGIPTIVSEMGRSLLVNAISASSIILSVFWFVLLVLAFEAVYIVLKFAIRYIKTDI